MLCIFKSTDDLIFEVLKRDTERVEFAMMRLQFIDSAPEGFAVVSRVVERAFTGGLEFKLAHKCLGAKKSGSGMLVEAEDMKSGSRIALECDKILVSTGRKPYSDGLGLEALGIERDKLDRWSKKVGWEVLLNRAGTTFRKLPDADRTDLNADKAIALMIAQPSMIKRPVLEGDGVTPDQAQACFADDRALDKVLADVQSGQGLGVRSTPALFINDQAYSNPGTAEAIAAILRQVGR